jgi:hypothetical protein
MTRKSRYWEVTLLVLGYRFYSCRAGRDRVL